MVEVDVQLLVGAAVTVFLALMFFGVVVLWDVALALRSVGDKIDKLEDNIDDDLMDIGHSLDNISSAPGGSGTQLHLSGGTISSGPEPAQAQGQQAQSHQPQQAGASAAGPQPQPQQPPQDDGSVGADIESEPTTATEIAEADDVADPEPSAAEVEADDAAATAEAEPTPAESEPEPAHPRARVNRGRFITSPDRTAWYAVSLDYESTRAPEPSIAGELTDGTVDESEIIAVGPAGASETNEPDDADEPADESPTAAGDDVLAFDEDGAGEGDESDDGDEPGADAAPEADTETNADVAGESTAVDTAENEHGAGSSEQSQRTATDLEPADETDLDVIDETGAQDGALETADEGTDDAVETGGARSDETEPATDSEVEPDIEAAVDQSPLGDVTAFEFEADLEDGNVTVEEAVDAINEDAPAPELSSHTFGVTAEVHRNDEGADGDGAVLVFEFDTDTVDISGSTKRLLQYQMRSFADRESTPEGDATIGRDRVVIEIPNADGDAVKRWGEAAVSIVDRTLYLSDNSSEEN